MTEPARLASRHLEDMAIVAMTTTPGAEIPTLYPDRDAATRGRLRARLKQLGRHDWPASLKDDPRLRRGYTLRQCFRLVSALALVDAQLGPSNAVAIAASNELAIMRTIVAAIETESARSANDRLAVCATGDLWALIDEQEFAGVEPDRLRWLERRALAELWSGQNDLACPGQRIVVDMGWIALAAWRWISARRLMPGDEFNAFRRELEVHTSEPGYRPAQGRTIRR